MIRRLRSREGCDRCRIRRKKCDEQRPICQACSRWNLLCTWSKRGLPCVDQGGYVPQAQVRDSVQDGLPQIARLPTLFCHQDGMLANGYQAFSSDREFYLANTCPLILSYILNPFATGQGRDTSRFTSLVLLHSSVRSAWVAFAAKILTLQDSSPSNAQKSYYAAVAGTRKALDNQTYAAQVFSLVAAMLFMGFYEIYGNGNPDLAFTHVTAILVLASDLLNKQQLVLAQSEFVFLKLSIEWAFFAVANTAIYQSDLSIFRQIDWALLNNLLNDASHPCHTPPLLHGKGEIFSIFCQVVALAREPPSHHVRLQLLSLAQQLNEMERLPSHSYGADSPTDVEKLFTLRWQFFVCSVRIYLLKVLHPRACSGAPSLRALVSQSLHTLRLMDIDSKIHSQWAIWPLPHSARHFTMDTNQAMFSHLSILLSAAHEVEFFEILEERGQALVGEIPWQHHEKMEKLRDIIWGRKRENLGYCTASEGTECTSPHDGLDFLLHRNGIFGILGEVDEVTPSP